MSAISFFGIAKDINFYPVKTPEVLSELSVTDIIQDTEGYLWIATYQGVYRYDGYEVQQYWMYDSLEKRVPNQYIRFLFKDRNSNLYAITSEFGIRKYNKPLNTFELVYRKNGLPIMGNKEAVWDIQEAANGIFWFVGTFGVARWNSIKDQLDFYQPFKDRQACYSVEKDKNGNIWFFGGIDAIAYLSPDKENFISVDLFSSYQINKTSQMGLLFCDSKNRLWISNESLGLVSYDLEKKEITFHQLNDYFLKANIVMNVMEARDGSLWFTSDGSGIYKLNTNGTWLNYKHEFKVPYSLPSNSIYTTYQARDGNIWVGTYNAGLVVYDPYKSGFISIDASPVNKLKLFNKSVLSIAPQGDHLIYMGTDGGGLEIWDMKKNTITHKSLSTGDFFTNVVKSLSLDNQLLYVGTYANGLGIFHTEKDKLVQVYNIRNKYYVNTISGYHVWSIGKLNDTMLLLGKLSGGLEIYNPKKKNFTANPFRKDVVTKLNAGIISSVSRVSDTLIYVGSEAAGLFKCYIQNDKFECVAVPLVSGLDYVNIQCIFLDPYQASVLWIGTVNSGLIEYDWKKEQLIRIHTLQFNYEGYHIKSIQKDKTGKLWIGTERGLLQYHPSDNKLVLYSKEDGLPSNRFNTNSSATLSDGQLIFGTTEGLLVFNPLHFNYTTPKQPTVITSVESKYTVSDDSLFIRKYFPSDKIELEYGKFILSIGFSALDYHAPNQVTYYYKLEGYDEHWTTEDADTRIASYYKLPPGTYTFLVKSKNREGVMDHTPTQLVIVIKRPWYMTSIFYIVCIVLFLGLIYLFFQWRTYRIRRINKKLQEEVAKQTAELVELNNSLQSTVDELTQRNEEIEQNNEEISAKTELILKQQKELLSKYSLWEDEVGNVPAEISFENPHKGAVIYLLEENESDAEKFMYLLSDQYIFYRFIKVDEIKNALAERLPDLIILNPIREQNEGLQFLEFLTNTDLYSAIPRIFITSIDSEEIQKTAIKYDVESILSKPLLINKIQHSILKSLEKVVLAKQKVISQLTTPLTNFHNPENEWLNRLINLITQNLSEPDLNAEFLCKEMAISKTLLYNKLKSISGQTVNELIRVIRLQKSTELLLQGKLTISEVAIETGFNSASYFSKSFTQFYGVSPKEFVRKNNS
jgi:ligand-binding sensor domain-containing protein/AraC-like DNA-binding protein